MKDQQVPRFSRQIQDRIYGVRAELVECCKQCGGSGYVAADFEHTVYRCDCMVLFRYIKELVKANIPEEYWKLTLAELHIEGHNKKLFNTFLSNLINAQRKGLGLVLCGKNGVGKTSVMCEVGKEAIVRGFNVRYFTLASYVNALFDKDEESVKNMEFGDFLLVDELDKRGGNISKAVDEFLRRMSNAGKCLIISTNWERDEIRQNLGESINSLLLRKCEFVLMTGVDFSLALSESFIEQLSGTYNYYHENIKQMADRREEIANV